MKERIRFITFSFLSEANVSAIIDALFGKVLKGKTVFKNCYFMFKNVKIFQTYFFVFLK